MIDQKTLGKMRILRYNDFYDFDISSFNLSSTEALAWGCLYRHTRWSTGTARVSYSRCATQCNCSDITAKRALKSLEEKQLIKRLFQGKGTASSVYALLDQTELMPQTVEMLRNKKSHPQDDDDE